MRTGLRKHQRHMEIRRQIDRPTTKYVDEFWASVRAKVAADRKAKEAQS